MEPNPIEKSPGLGSERLLDYIRLHRDDQVRMLAELVKVPSDNPPGDCAAHADRAAQLYEGLGFTVERHKVPDALVASVGMISATNLIVRHRFGPGPTIALNAHGDVVAPGEGWTVDPYGAEIKDGWMYGRGVATSKSDFVTYAYALLALRALGEKLSGTIEIHLTYDEEVGGDIGPLHLLQQGLTKPDYAICAGLSYGVVTAHNGCLHLDIDVRGKSAHAARPETGIDALEAATHILSRLYSLRSGFSEQRSSVEGITTPSLVVGLISGGINTNVVPDKIVMRVDRRMIPEENGPEVARDLIAFIEATAREIPGVECHVRQLMLANPLKPLVGQERLAGALQRHASELAGEAVPTHGVPLYTDARHYSNAGIPTVLYGAGPRTMLEANAHRADEKLKIDDLVLATNVVTLALYDMLTGNA
ncbi:ArgE/DapE family deacylase (plasmid) [Aminobacter sp. MDW-2]|uniref:Probable succinyl-diaminopimelate desuccinylase n=2 Tax=Phyllobacteriaceae TaxID=69277 RepID=A0AAC8YUI8_AMIAI|nr:Acetylornithine deacetylase or succinyl-diaminopimelate desuccinylase [Aminobacter aminovorans]MBB3704226.1 acetylornithine deacetylase/succinyl-diaminopimelate desuccinylase family protein [Aminobacter aminovorans]MRX32530.1 ArgE/DapE family deacylase [Aminobacter sp. MDW-2]QNH37655.1 ArgE/DapE family deacylase [Aminobacter sp. MDW-2]